MFGVPIVAIVLLDGERICCKARIGCERPEVFVRYELSRLVLADGDHVVIPDTLVDPRTAAANVVREAPFVRFFAGAPLLARDGAQIGCVCLMDIRPRPDFSDGQASQLAELAGLVLLLLERARDHRIQAEEAAEHALINDILLSMTTASNLSGAIETTVERLRRDTGAMICTLAEFDPRDGLVHFVAAHVAPQILPADVADLYANMPVSPSHLVMGNIYESDLCSFEMQSYEKEPGDNGAFRIRDKMHTMGICCATHLSLHVGIRRFSLSLNFDTPRPDLAALTQRLVRVQRAIRPMLQRKVDEERLALLSAALAVTHDAVVITEAEPIDLPGPRIVYVNEGFTTMTGWSAADAIGRTPRILQTSKTDRAELDRLRAALKAWEPVRVELLNQRRDGTPIWVELDIRPLADATGWFTHWVAVQRDITERRMREETEREATATAKRLADELLTANRIARMGTWQWMPRSKTLKWSPEVCRILDLDPATITPSLSLFMQMVHPDDQAHVRQRIGTAIAPDGVIEIDFRIMTPAGAVRHCWLQGHPELDPEGGIVSVGGFCQDVTERRQAEVMLQHTEKLKSIGQLTGGIAHDFNNLLTVISINMEIAKELVGPDHPATEVIQPALLAAASGAELTSSLLAFARRQPLNPQPIDVNRVMEEFHSLASRSLGERHVVRLDLRHDLPQCRVDRAKLENAVLNLVLNSRDAMEQGGTITIRTGLAIISPSEARRIGELSPGPHITLAVSDTGDGIPLFIQQRVFDPFFTTKGLGKGSGLGLSMVMGFVRQSGGQVTLDSQPGAGTTLRLYLPIEQVPA